MYISSFENITRFSETFVEHLTKIVFDRYRNLTKQSSFVLESFLGYLGRVFAKCHKVTQSIEKESGGLTNYVRLDNKKNYVFCSL